MRSILNELSDYLADWSYPIQITLTDDIKCFLSQFTNGKDQRMWVMWQSLTFINLCFVTIVNKDIFFPGEIHWHPLKVFKSHMAMQKVILHLVIYNYKATPKSCIPVFTISLSSFVNAFRSSLFSVFLINLTVPQLFVLTRSTNIVTETLTHKTWQIQT